MDFSTASAVRRMSGSDEKFRFNPEAALAATGAFFGGLLLLRLFPGASLEFFARGAANLAGFFTGTPVFRGDSCWVVPLAGAPVVVTIACSAADYFLIVASLLGFQFTRLGMRWFNAVGVGLIAAFPLAVLVNALRIITVAHAHPLLISRLPVAYTSFLHMTVGAAVFLPSLIVLNVLLEAYGRHRRPHLHLVRV